MTSVSLIQRIRWCLVFLACAGSTLGSAAHAQRVGTFKTVEGLVWIERHGSYVHPKNGDGWLPGDRLFTGTNGSAVLNLRDGTLLTLAHGVQLDFDRLTLNEGVQREGFVLRLMQGTMRIVSGMLIQINPQLFQLETPSAIMGVRGTDFITSTSPRWWPWQRTRVTLLPDGQATPSAVVIQVGSKTQTLDQPYQTATAASDGHTQTGQTSAAALRWFGADLWSDRVAPAQRLSLYFEAGGVTLTPASAAEFNAFVARFQGRTDVDFMVIGHTDRVGEANANEALSLKRAQAVGQTLSQQGFDAERTQAFGMGERRPLKPTDDDVAEALNRRVELVAR
jgi:outer membrane protein OmpA-like peptidoglycan-associated protein